MAFSKKSFQIKFRNFLNYYARPRQNIEQPVVKMLSSKYLDRSVQVDLYLPPGYRHHSRYRYPCIFFNDGQDMTAMQLPTTLQAYYRNKNNSPFVLAAIHAGDRMQEYGTAAQYDYKNRGSRATQYTRFILEELLPLLQSHYHCSPTGHAIAGCSLGGLSAFDIAWNHSDVFRKVGIFSGSLWWRSKAFRQKTPDADRIVHQMVANHTGTRPPLQFWLQAGTKDESSDRNNNGIIDAIDDTQDLISALQQQGFPAEDMTYVEVKDGEHNTKTWGEVLPDFLAWTMK